MCAPPWHTLAPGAIKGYSRLPSSDFITEVCPRGLLRRRSYNPADFADRVRVPALIQLALRDALVSPRTHERIVASMGEMARAKEYDVDHFGIYSGEAFERAVADQTAFFVECLG